MSSNTANNGNQYVNMARTMASSPQALEAGMVARETAQEIQNEVQGDEWSLRVMSLMAGCAMMLVSLHGFFGKFVTFYWVSAILDAIVFTVGLGVVLVESGVLDRVDSCASTNNLINSNAPFLRKLHGRGIIFVVTGLIELYIGGILDTIVGIFAIYVGLSYIWMGYRAKKKLSEARSMAMQSNTLSMEDIQEKYAMADVDGKGGLNLSQFRQFIQSLGMELNKKESEAAFMNMDKNHDGRCSYDDVHRWWSNEEKIYSKSLET